MNIKTLIKCIPLQRNPIKYIEYVKGYDCKKILADDPISIKDKHYDNTDLVETGLDDTTAFYDIHKKLLKKYNLSSVAVGDTDFEKALQILFWLTENTFYNGAQMHSLTDNSLDILDYSFGKSFKNAINCRLKAITFADCLVAVGIKAYPVCMQSTEFKNCHFTCRVYISELDKWCSFDPSFGCWFTDNEGKLIDISEMREMFFADKEPVVNGYNFNGTTECRDTYVSVFLKSCISNLSTWKDNSMDRRDTKKLPDKKVFNAKLPE